jgi:hypothetical protein
MDEVLVENVIDNPDHALNPAPDPCHWLRIL